MKIIFRMHGRLFDLDVEPECDEFHQFRVSLKIDEKDRFSSYFTDRAEETADPRSNLP